MLRPVPLVVADSVSASECAQVVNVSITGVYVFFYISISLPIFGMEFEDIYDNENKQVAPCIP